MQGAEALLSGVSTATFSSYITILLVDRSFRRQKKNRRKKMRSAALRQLEGDLVSHLNFLVNMYIAASEEHPDKIPETYDDLFTDEFFKTVQYLDFSKEYPTARDSRFIRWFDYAESHLNGFQNAIDQAISQYSMWLDPEVVETLQEIRGSTFSGMVITASETDMMQLDKEMGYEREYTVFFGYEEFVEEHTNALLALVQEYEKSQDVELTEVGDLNAWSEEIAPTAGTARRNPESVTRPNRQE
ncbi:hypothetical protein [Halobacterium hubeiense]|uniref:hypothetical protein n=1 Tax=Halobacterium hubeiense TaxID=1407499 RepID=UPI003C70623B